MTADDKSDEWSEKLLPVAFVQNSNPVPHALCWQTLTYIITKVRLLLTMSDWRGLPNIDYLPLACNLTSFALFVSLGWVFARPRFRTGLRWTIYRELQHHLIALVFVHSRSKAFVGSYVEHWCNCPG